MNGKQFAVPTFLVIGIFGAIFGYGKLNGKVEHQAKDIEALQETPVKIATIEQKIEDIKEDVGEIKAEQVKQRDTLQEILRAVK